MTEGPRSGTRGPVKYLKCVDQETWAAGQRNPVQATPGRISVYAYGRLLSDLYLVTGLP